MRLVVTLRTAARLHAYSALRSAALAIPVVAFVAAVASGSHVQPLLNHWG